MGWYVLILSNKRRISRKISIKEQDSALLSPNNHHRTFRKPWPIPQTPYIKKLEDKLYECPEYLAKSRSVFYTMTT